MNLRLQMKNTFATVYLALLAQTSYNVDILLLSRRCYLEGLELTHLLVDALLDKKGVDILVLDIHEQAIFTDFFILCNGESEPQLRALMQAVVENAKKGGERRPKGIEGQPVDGWILIDYGDVVVHLFSPEKREYYDLESLWHQSRVVVRMQ